MGQKQRELLSMKKGMEFSINILFALVLVAIVLTGLIILLTGTFNKSGDQSSCSQEFQNACNRYITAGGCDNSEVDITRYMDSDIMRCGAGTSNSDIARRSCCFQ